MQEGEGKAYNKREKGKAGETKGKRERRETLNLIRDPTRQADQGGAWRDEGRATESTTTGKICKT